MKYYRLQQLIGDKKKGIEPLLPISRSQVYAMIKAGTFPSPVKLGKSSLWRESDILALEQPKG